MYEEILNYFETNLCVENIYFRKNYKKWIIGIVSTVIVELLINFLVMKIINNLLVALIINFIIDSIVVFLLFLFIYLVPIIKIYKSKTKSKIKIDYIGLLMKEDKLGEYRKIEIQEMERFLKKDCKIKTIPPIDIVINAIDQELEKDYNKSNSFNEHFTSSKLPIILCKKILYGFKSIIPVDKKENLLELKKVLIDIKLKWSK